MRHQSESVPAVASPAPYRCPGCGRDGLAGTPGAELRCESCHATYPSTQGVPDFLGTDQHWDFAPPDLMAEVLPMARTRGWEAALDHMLEAVNLRERKSYFVGGERLWWHWITPVNSGSRVLVIGSGLGAEIRELTSLASFVHGIDITPENLQFVAERLKQERVENFRLARASAVDLPFPDESFDMIQLIGVFEWIGYSGTELSPMAYQRKALAEFYRCLKPSGTLVIGTENRYCWGYFLGGRDQHLGLPFLGLLSPGVGSLLTRPLLGKPYRVVLHSYARLQRIARRSGFLGPEMYYPFPSYALPRALVPLWSHAAMKYFGEVVLRGHPRMNAAARLLFGLIERLGLLRWLCSDFLMVTSKPGPTRPAPRVATVVDAAGRSFLMTRANRVSCFELNGDRAPLRVHKIRRDPYEGHPTVPNAAVVHEHEFLQHLDRMRLEDGFPHSPRPLGLNEVEGTTIASQSFLEGKVLPIPAGRSAAFESRLGQAFDWLRRFQKMTAREVPADEAACRTWYAAPLESGFAQLPATLRGRAADVMRPLLEAPPSRVPVASGHGDLHLGHFLWNSRGIAGVVDWEFGREVQLAPLDWLTLVMVLYRSIVTPDDPDRSRATPSALEVTFGKGVWISPFVNRVIDAEFNGWGYAPDQRAALLMLFVFFRNFDDPGPSIEIIVREHDTGRIPFRP